jgi:photosystem II stability/assembly factor-like uncharacterized protein
MTAFDHRSARFITIIPDGEEGGLLAATAAGILRSDDGGQRWRLFAPQLAGLVGTVASGITPEHDEIIVAGGDGGVLHSADGGVSWTTTLTGSPVYALAIAPNEADALVTVGGTATDGIFRSLDGGRHWTSANAGLFDLEVLALAMSPAFAADNTAFAGTVGGLYRSRNGGQAWRLLPVPDGDPVIQCIACSPDFEATGTVLAGTEEDGLLRSCDGGESWASVTDLASLGVLAIAWSQASPDVAIASTEDGLARSQDAGATWRIISNTEPALSLAVLTMAEHELIVGGRVDGGLIVSPDSGESWRDGVRPTSVASTPPSPQE